MDRRTGETKRDQRKTDFSISITGHHQEEHQWNNNGRLQNLTTTTDNIPKKREQPIGAQSPRCPSNHSPTINFQRWSSGYFLAKTAKNDILREMGYITEVTDWGLILSGVGNVGINVINWISKREFMGQLKPRKEGDIFECTSEADGSSSPGNFTFLDLSSQKHRERGNQWQRRAKTYGGLNKRPWEPHSPILTHLHGGRRGRGKHTNLVGLADMPLAIVIIGGRSVGGVGGIALVYGHGRRLQQSGFNRVRTSPMGEGGWGIPPLLQK